MAENADSAITLYEGQHENPELIWTEEIKEATSLYIMRSSRDLASQQRWISRAKINITYPKWKTLDVAGSRTYAPYYLFKSSQSQARIQKHGVWNTFFYRYSILLDKMNPFITKVNK